MHKYASLYQLVASQRIGSHPAPNTSRTSSRQQVVVVGARSVASVVIAVSLKLQAQSVMSSIARDNISVTWSRLLRCVRQLLIPLVIGTDVFAVINRSEVVFVVFVFVAVFDCAIA